MATSPSSSTSEAEIEELQARRSTKIKGIAQAFLQFTNNDLLPVSDLPLTSRSADTDAIGERIINNVCESVEGSSRFDGSLVPAIHESIEGELTQLAGPSSGDDELKLAETALGLFTAGPLDCGYKRYSLLVEPQDRCDGALINALREHCPTVATFSTSVSSAYLVREGTGLEPLHLGARLAELYPDIAEAAGRLHTRNDVNWLDLRESVPKPDALPH